MYDGEDFTSDTAGLWEGGKEWSVPRLGKTGVPGVSEDGVDTLGYDECDLMLEDVVERMDQGLKWLDTAGCESYRRCVVRLGSLMFGYGFNVVDPQEQVDQLKARIHFRKASRVMVMKYPVAVADPMSGIRGRTS